MQLIKSTGVQYIAVLFAFLVMIIFSNLINKYFITSRNESLQGKIIDFPDYLTMVNFERGDSLIRFDDINNIYKLICVFNAGCGYCIINLGYTDNIFQKYNNSTEISCFSIAKNMTTDTVLLKYILNKANIKLHTPVFMDTTMRFYRKNKEICSIPENMLFLLDKNNKVILYDKIDEDGAGLEMIERYIQ